MTPHAHITDELLSAYIDNEVTAQERALVEDAIERDPDVAWRLASLRYTVDLVRQLPELAPPRTFTLTEKQAAGILTGALTAPAPAVRSAGAAPSWLDRLRNVFQAGNAVWRNAAAACAVLLVVILLGGEFLTAPLAPEMQVRNQTSEPGTPLSAPAAVTDADDAPAADAATLDTAPAPNTDTEADTPFSNGAATTVELPPAGAAGDDVGESNGLGESDSVVASAAVTEAAPMEAAPMEAAAEPRGNRAAAQEAPLGALGMQSAPLSSPGSEDELQALMAPPIPDAGPPLTEPVAAASAAGTADAPAVTQDATPDVAPAALALDEASAAGNTAESPLAKVEVPAEGEQAAQDLALSAQSAPLREDATGNQTEIEPLMPTVQSVEPSAAGSGTAAVGTAATGTATVAAADPLQRQAPAWLAGVQLTLAALALLFALLWLLSIRATATNPARQVDRS